MLYFIMRNTSKLISRNCICFGDYILVYSMRHGVSQNTATHPVLFAGIWLVFVYSTMNMAGFRSMRRDADTNICPIAHCQLRTLLFGVMPIVRRRRNHFCLIARYQSDTALWRVIANLSIKNVAGTTFYAFCNWSHDKPVTVTGVGTDYFLSRHVGQKCIFDSIMHTFEWPAKTCDWAQNYWKQHSRI
jgi:hypothetical protein